MKFETFNWKFAAFMCRTGLEHANENNSKAMLIALMALEENHNDI